MEISKDKNILIVGLGLMGGSFAKGMRNQGFHVCGFARRKEPIEFALANGIIDEGYSEVNTDAISRADILVFALYPKAFLEWMEQYQQYLKPGAIITDVTGVKSCIVHDMQAILRDDVEFIAAHPMCGREVYGVENSTEKMFIGANYIVVPTDKNTEEGIEICKELGRLLGAGKISVLSPEEHDEMIGFVSQLTHVIAVSLMNSSDNHNLVNYTGDSFRDLTRIARINENMWSELFLLNKDALTKQMDIFIDVFTKMRDMVQNDDREGLCEMMRISTERRAWFDKK